MEWVIISRPPLAKPNEPPRGRARRTGLTQIPVSKDRRGRARRTRPLEPTDFPDRLSGVPRRRAQRGQGPGARFEPSAPWAEMSAVGQVNETALAVVCGSGWGGQCGIGMGLSCVEIWGFEPHSRQEQTHD